MKYIYLHGFASGPKSKKARYFKRQFKKQNIDLIIPDLNCNQFQRLTLSCQIEMIAHIIKKYKKESFILIGSSLGGYVATLCANFIHQYPLFKKIKTLVLLAPAFAFTREILEKDPDKLKEWKQKGFIEVEHYQWNQTLPLYYDLYTDAKQYESVSLERPIPSVIFHGIEDKTVPYHVSIDYVKQNPKAQLILLQSDHSLFNSLKLIWEYTKHFIIR